MNDRNDPDPTIESSLPEMAAADLTYLSELLGDVRGFFADLLARLDTAGIDVSPYPLGHLAFRATNVEQYLRLRHRIEAISSANVEDVWHQRPISKLLLRNALTIGEHHCLSLVELIPPPHRPQYRLGLEHVGFVVGDDFDAFARAHRTVISGQQDQGPFNQPLFVSFANGCLVKFHRHSLQEVVVMEGHTFDGFHHASTGYSAAD